MGPKVAIVEDVADTQDKFRAYVKSLWPDADVKLFGNAESAVAALESGQFDVVITDIDLGPGLESVGGFKVAKALAGTSTPLIVVSGAVIPNEYRLAFKAMGAWDYLQKPISEGDLHHQLERALPFREAQKRGPERSAKNPGQTIDPRFQVDIGARDQIRWKGERVVLTMSHIRILQKLLEKADQPVKYDDLYKVLKSGTTITNLRQHISEMRAAFTEADPDFEAIQTTQFVGYSWSTR